MFKYIKPEENLSYYYKKNVPWTLGSLHFSYYFVQTLVNAGWSFRAISLKTMENADFLFFVWKNRKNSRILLESWKRERLTRKILAFINILM